MEIRGVGSLLGTRQSGIIHTIGFTYYNRLLDQTIKNIQEQKTGEDIHEDKVKIQRLQIESDFYFPESYITNEKERLNIYRKMLNFKKEEEFINLENELYDRFGKIPEQALNAIIFYKLNMLVQKAELESFSIKKGEAILELNNSKLPAREKINELVNTFNYPVKFDSTGNLKITFSIFREKTFNKKVLYEKSLKIIRFFINKK
ncbi:MAG: hypothetical protein KAT74_12180, partial [Candidatus Cloacimonetes bacterium]|nr:hypothetical protein [Candidatus Cloacimonadota bacterium]